jgi:hypothetical protein
MDEDNANSSSDSAPSAPLDLNQSLFQLLTDLQNSIKDLTNNNYAGIADTTTLNFS